jgi:hypothetical protein
MYYRQAGAQAEPHVSQALEWLRANVSGSARIMEDSKRLSSILKVEREDLCKRQSAR